MVYNELNYNSRSDFYWIKELNSDKMMKKY